MSPSQGPGALSHNLHCTHLHKPYLPTCRKIIACVHAHVLPFPCDCASEHTHWCCSLLSPLGRHAHVTAVLMAPIAAAAFRGTSLYHSIQASPPVPQHVGMTACPLVPQHPGMPASASACWHDRLSTCATVCVGRGPMVCSCGSESPLMPVCGSESALTPMPVRTSTGDNVRGNVCALTSCAQLCHSSMPRLSAARPHGRSHLSGPSQVKFQVG